MPSKETNAPDASSQNRNLMGLAAPLEQAAANKEQLEGLNKCTYRNLEFEQYICARV